MKADYKKDEKELYQPNDQPRLLTVGKQKFFCIQGTGNPNTPAFSERVSVLYSLAYAVRMMPKNDCTPDGYQEYTVYPLEGIWDLSEEAKKKSTFTKADLVYALMIRQPDFVTEEVAALAFEIVKKKKPHRLLKEACFEEIEDGLAVQILHRGAYDDEPASFQKMEEFLSANGLVRRSHVHREIYLSDARKTESNQLKTILRYSVMKA